MFTTNHPDPLKILSSTRPLVENARFVTINPAAIDEFLAHLKPKLTAIAGSYATSLKHGETLDESVQLLFIMSSVNFCFWAAPREKKWSVEWPVGVVSKGGFFSLVSVFRRALATGMPLADAGYLATLPLADAEELFRGYDGTSIPLFEERVANLREIGRVLALSYEGKAMNLIEEAGFDAVNLATLLVEEFPSFADIVAHDNGRYMFLKRAQLFVNDLVHLAEFFPEFKLLNTDQIVTLADYRLPQVLEHFGLISYADDLMQRLKAYDELAPGSREELEIRAATIWAVELVRQQLGVPATTTVDTAIWLLAQDLREDMKPHHRTRTTAY